MHTSSRHGKTLANSVHHNACIIPIGNTQNASNYHRKPGPFSIPDFIRLISYLRAASTTNATVPSTTRDTADAVFSILSLHFSSLSPQAPGAVNAVLRRAMILATLSSPSTGTGGLVTKSLSPQAAMEMVAVDDGFLRRGGEGWGGGIVGTKILTFAL